MNILKVISHTKNMKNPFKSKTDPQGSYTGNSFDQEKPIQDADDL